MKLNELKAGEIVWECDRGRNVQLQVREDAKKVEATETQEAGWEVLVCLFGREQDSFYLFGADGREAYWPKLYETAQFANK